MYENSTKHTCEQIWLMVEKFNSSAYDLEQIRTSWIILIPIIKNITTSV